ncbi:hypothetical protein [uncultured Phocaeicola sp.]|uniref:hypothetical protein n=1 Tax=uncultured Phocaeicola sp. TaxID=990718 RepID=UPI0025A21FBB|nr:hypothetical protein [uncultured Phocaeicola sp.]
MNCAADISQYHYDLGFQDGYMACKEEYTERAKQKQEQRIKEREKALYFLRQKLLGVFVLIFTAISIWLLDGDATIGAIMIPLGVALVFSKKPIIYGKYYWEMEDEST